jgi:hypothetical protein
MISSYGCPPESGKTKPVTITAVDCPADSIVITPTITVAGTTNNWVVAVNVNVKCNGKNISNAEVKVNYAYTDYKITTDGSGNASARARVQTNDRPSGTATVTVKASDGTNVDKPAPVN